MKVKWGMSFGSSMPHLFLYQVGDIAYFVCGLQVPADMIWLPLDSGYYVKPCDVCKRVETMQELAE